MPVPNQIKEPPIGLAGPVAASCRNAPEAALAGLPSPQYITNITNDIPAALQSPELPDALADMLRPYAATQETAAAEASDGLAEDVATEKARLDDVAMAPVRLVRLRAELKTEPGHTQLTVESAMATIMLAQAEIALC